MTLQMAWLFQVRPVEKKTKLSHKKIITNLSCCFLATHDSLTFPNYGHHMIRLVYEEFMIIWSIWYMKGLWHTNSGSIVSSTLKFP